MKFIDEKIIAEYENTFYEVVSIEGITSEELVKASRKEFGDIWQKRIREDIAEVLIEAGVAEETTSVSLELKDLETGATKSVENAEMTRENRSILYAK